MFKYCLPQFCVSGFDEQLKTQSMFLHSTRHIFNPNRLTLPTKFNSRFTPFDTMQTPSVRRPTGVHRPAVWTCAGACHRACSVSGQSEDILRRCCRIGERLLNKLDSTGVHLFGQCSHLRHISWVFEYDHVLRV